MSNVITQGTQVEESYSLSSKIRKYMQFFSILTKVMPYTTCNSKPVCSLLLAEEEVSECSLSSVDFISWMGGAFTMVVSGKKLSESLPFISLCSWHKAHQCMQQCTQHGSHGEFCSHQKNKWENLKSKTRFICWENHKS